MKLKKSEEDFKEGEKLETKNLADEKKETLLNEDEKDDETLKNSCYCKHFLKFSKIRSVLTNLENICKIMLKIVKINLYGGKPMKKNIGLKFKVFFAAFLLVGGLCDGVLAASSRFNTSILPLEKGKTDAKKKKKKRVKSNMIRGVRVNLLIPEDPSKGGSLKNEKRILEVIFDVKNNLSGTAVFNKREASVYLKTDYFTEQPLLHSKPSKFANLKHPYKEYEKDKVYIHPGRSKKVSVFFELSEKAVGLSDDEILASLKVVYGYLDSETQYKFKKRYENFASELDEENKDKNFDFEIDEDKKDEDSKSAESDEDSKEKIDAESNEDNKGENFNFEPNKGNRYEKINSKLNKENEVVDAENIKGEMIEVDFPFSGVWNNVAKLKDVIDSINAMNFEGLFSDSLFFKESDKVREDGQECWVWRLRFINRSDKTVRLRFKNFLVNGVDLDGDSSKIYHLKPLFLNMGEKGKEIFKKTGIVINDDFETIIEPGGISRDFALILPLPCDNIKESRDMIMYKTFDFCFSYQKNNDENLKKEELQSNNKKEGPQENSAIKGSEIGEDLGQLKNVEISQLNDMNKTNLKSIDKAKDLKSNSKESGKTTNNFRINSNNLPEYYDADGFKMPLDVKVSKLNKMNKTNLWDVNKGKDSKATDNSQINLNNSQKYGSFKKTMDLNVSKLNDTNKTISSVNSVEDVKSNPKKDDKATDNSQINLNNSQQQNNPNLGNLQANSMMMNAMNFWQFFNSLNAAACGGFNQQNVSNFQNMMSNVQPIVRTSQSGARYEMWPLPQYVMVPMPTGMMSANPLDNSNPGGANLLPVQAQSNRWGNFEIDRQTQFQSEEGAKSDKNQTDKQQSNDKQKK